MSQDPAFARFIVIQLVRWSGVAMVLVGLMIIVGKIDLPRIAGVVLAAAGLVEAMLMPLLLSRRWKTPPE
ncbi:MAG TPA: hypothetical protein VHG29_07080 [Novosphingobium sp.]|nr:hypothetical protein [Novosphingobium sp.]